MSLIGQTFTHHGMKGAKQVATVVGEEVFTRGKRSRVLAIIRLADGTEFKMAATSVPTAIEFAEPETGPMFRRGDTDHYGDVRRMFGNSSNAKG